MCCCFFSSQIHSTSNVLSSDLVGRWWSCTLVLWITTLFPAQIAFSTLCRKKKDDLFSLSELHSPHAFYRQGVVTGFGLPSVVLLPLFLCCFTRFPPALLVSCHNTWFPVVPLWELGMQHILRSIRSVLFFFSFGFVVPRSVIASWLLSCKD